MVGAQAVMKELEKLCSAFQGVELPGHSREEGSLNNADIIDYLAEGGRDITSNDEDVELAALAFVAEAEPFLQRAAQSQTPPSAGKASSVSGKAWRAAGLVVLFKMRDRVEAGQNSDGSSKPVSERYAEWRLKKHSIPKHVIFKATGQLLTNLSGGKAALKLIR